MKKLAKAMYGKSMMKNGGMKKMADGGVGKSKASGGKGSISDMTPNSSSGEVNGPNTIYAPGKKKTESTKTYKTGGIIKAKKGIIMGPGDGGKKKKKSSTPPEENTPITKPEVATSKKTYKNPLMARAASYFTGKTEYQKNENPINKMSTTRTFKDGKKTRVLKVKNQEEKKMGGAKMKMGGSTKYKDGGMKKATTMNPTSRSTAMTALGVDKKNQYSPSKFDDNVTSYARGTGAKKMKTGGMVNSNAGVKKQTVPGSKGVISGENPKASASKVAKGRPTKSTAPKKANP